MFALVLPLVHVPSNPASTSSQSQSILLRTPCLAHTSQPRGGEKRQQRDDNRLFLHKRGGCGGGKLRRSTRLASRKSHRIRSSYSRHHASTWRRGVSLAPSPCSRGHPKSKDLVRNSVSGMRALRRGCWFVVDQRRVSFLFGNRSVPVVVEGDRATSHRGFESRQTIHDCCF